jgi:hypothetical protein
MIIDFTGICFLLVTYKEACGWKLTMREEFCLINSYFFLILANPWPMIWQFIYFLSRFAILAMEKRHKVRTRSLALMSWLILGILVTGICLACSDVLFD